MYSTLLDIITQGTAGNCDFESGLCMYEDASDEQSPWMMYDGHNNYMGVIDHDHTTGSLLSHCHIWPFLHYSMLKVLNILNVIIS